MLYIAHHHAPAAPAPHATLQGPRPPAPRTPRLLPHPLLAARLLAPPATCMSSQRLLGARGLWQLQASGGKGRSLRGVRAAQKPHRHRNSMAARPHCPWSAQQGCLCSHQEAGRTSSASRAAWARRCRPSALRPAERPASTSVLSKYRDMVKGLLRLEKQGCDLQLHTTPTHSLAPPTSQPDGPRHGCQWPL